MCNSLIHHLYIVLCVHHPKSSSGIINPHFILLYPLLLPPPTPPFPSGNHHTVVCGYEDIFSLIPSSFSPSHPTLLLSDSCQSVFCIYETLNRQTIPSETEAVVKKVPTTKKSPGLDDFTGKQYEKN